MKKLLFLILLITALQSSAQLDPLYSQYMHNQLMINPAYVGIYNRFSAGLISRLQWAGIEGAPVTNTLTMQTAIREGRVGLGGFIVNDRLGINNNLESQVAASYNIRIGEAKLGLGIQGGLINYRYDLNKLELDYIDDERLVGLNNLTEPNFGAGVIYMAKNIFAGVSMPRIRNIKVKDGVSNSTRYKRHIYLNGGYVFESSNFTQYKVMSLIRLVDGERPSFDLSVSSYIDRIIWAGLTTRDLKHFGLFTILELGNNLRLGYTFEMPTNSLVQSNYGTHEISIAFDMALSRNHVIKNRQF